ncbi:MAG: hypothetical protein LBC83_00640 [Oscillospiraceae bacterium]|nr:hypothetical protein [Oscillospiraceae bacterium]
MNIFLPLFALVGQLGAGLLAVIQLWLGALGVPVGQTADSAANPYLVGSGSAWVSAHRLGGGEAPENSLMAVKRTVDAARRTAQILEMDVQMTRDGELILLHNTFFDDTTNAAEAFGHVGVAPIYYTYGQLWEKINLGAKWDAPYADLRGADIPADLRVTRLRDVLQYAEAHGDPKKPYYYTIEAKQLGMLGYIAADRLVALCAEMGVLERVTFGSFFPDVSAYVSRKYPDVARCADTLDVLRFANCYLRGADLLREAAPAYDVLLLPYGGSISWLVDFGTPEVVAYAHKYGLAVHFWTVNDPADAKKLSAADADGIITDEPGLIRTALAAAA